jgi:hypothetical protein
MTGSSSEMGASVLLVRGITGSFRLGALPAGVRTGRTM